MQSPGNPREGLTPSLTVGTAKELHLQLLVWEYKLIQVWFAFCKW